MSGKSKKAVPEFMQIPYPVAFPEDRVLVLNYRKKPAQWEEGVVHSFSFVPAYVRTCYDGSEHEVPCNWTFNVWVSRPTKADKYGRISGDDYAISVGPESIRPVKEGK